jgi:hypothetical protein
MFDFVVLRRTGLDDRVLDVGLLAETLLFYQKIHLLLDNGTLGYLLKTIGGERLLALIERKGITAAFLRDNIGTVKNIESGLAFYNFAQFQFSGTPDKKHMNDKEWFQLMVERNLGSSRETKRLAKRLCDAISFAHLKDKALKGTDLPTVAREDLRDVVFVDEAVRQALAELLPSVELPSGWFFRPHLIGTEYGGQQQFVIETNLNFPNLNLRYHERIPPSHSSLSPEFLVNYIFGAREAILISSRHMAELVVDPATTAVVKLRYLELMRKRDRQVEEMDLFQEMHLSEARTVRETINNGERTFDEFLKVLDRAERFKSWLAARNPDQHLLQEYYAEVMKESWLNKLSSKTTRWVIATGLGLAVESLYPTGAAITAAQGVSLFDATMLDKILKGWRPNQFVDDVLAPFVSRKRQ